MASAFQIILMELCILEKKSKKYYSKIRKLTPYPALAKALDKKHTGIDAHIKRLNLIITSYKGKEKKAAPLQPTLPPIPTKDTDDAVHDLRIISSVQQVIQQKMIYYRLLSKMAATKDTPDLSMLFKYAILENQGTSARLDALVLRLFSDE